MLRIDLLSKYPKALAILNVFMALFLSVAALVFVRELLSAAYGKAKKPVYSSSASSQKTRQGLREYGAILKNNPFGFPAGQLKELSVSDEGSVSYSDIKLIGTVAGPSARSYAIFADKNGRQEVFRIGESVFGAGKLKKVESDKVFIIGIGGGREINIPLAEIVAVKEVGPPEGAAGSDFARSLGRGSYIVDQKKILHALENPNQLMTDARLQPNLVSGRQEGFILREVRSGGIYQSLGLQNGDVLLRINDYNISNPDNALQAFTALRGMDRVQVDLLRSGSKITMTYQIR